MFWLLNWLTWQLFEKGGCCSALKVKLASEPRTGRVSPEALGRHSATMAPPFTPLLSDYLFILRSLSLLPTLDPDIRQIVVLAFGRRNPQIWSVRDCSPSCTVPRPLWF